MDMSNDIQMRLANRSTPLALAGRSLASRWRAAEPSQYKGVGKHSSNRIGAEMLPFPFIVERSLKGSISAMIEPAMG
jgi:hypothetical protein